MTTNKPGWAKGSTPESWACIDCGINTAPGCPSRVQMEQAFAASALTDKQSVEIKLDHLSEVYMVKPRVWKAAGMNAGMGGFGDTNGDSGCLCIGCLEERIGRTLRPKDFNHKHPFHSFPGTPRLLARRDGDIVIECDGDELFIIVKGVKIARRGYPDSPQAKTWVPLEPGWRVLDGPKNSISIECDGVSVQ